MVNGYNNNMVGMGGAPMGGYPQQGMYNAYYAQPYNYGMPVNFGGVPNNVRTTTILSPEQEKTLRGEKANIYDLNLSEYDLLLQYCDHKPSQSNPNVPVYRELNDGSGNIYCTRCKAVFPREIYPDESIAQAIDVITGSFQQAKMFTNIPEKTIKDIGVIVGMLPKWKDIYINLMKIAENNYGDWMTGANIMSSDVMFDIVNGIDRNYYNMYNQYQYQPQMMMQQQNMMNAPASNVNPMQQQMPYGFAQPQQGYVNGMYNPYAQPTQQPVAQPMQQQPAQQQPATQPMQQQSTQPYVPQQSAAQQPTQQLKINI